MGREVETGLFHAKCVMPELCVVESASTSTSKYCICGGEDDGRTIIVYDSGTM